MNNSWPINPPWKCAYCYDIGVKAHPDYIPLVMGGLAGRDVTAEIDALKEALGKKGSRSQNWMMIPCDHTGGTS